MDRFSVRIDVMRGDTVVEILKRMRSGTVTAWESVERAQDAAREFAGLAGAVINNVGGCRNRGHNVLIAVIDHEKCEVTNSIIL